MGSGLTAPAVETPEVLTEGVLVVLPPAGFRAPTGGDAGSVRSDTPVAGLPLLRRIALAAARAGFTRVLVAHPGPGDAALLAGTGATPLTSNADAAPSFTRARVVFLSANVVPAPQSLRRLLELPVAPERLYADASTAALIVTKDTASVLALAARASSVADVRAAWHARFGNHDATLDVVAGVSLGTTADVRAAERWLLRGLIKPNEGFMSKHFERRVSLAITRRLVGTGLTPNAMTVVSVAIGLAGAPFFLSASPAMQMAGALLFLAHSILDGCDGELARLKFLESPGGAVLDFWGDNVVHAAVFSSIALGWAMRAGALWPLLFGGLTVLSTALVALTVWRQGLMKAALDEHAPPRLRLVAMLVHRDFIYVIIALAAFGKVGWFLVVTAIGAPLFFGVIAWAGPTRLAS